MRQGDAGIGGPRYTKKQIPGCEETEHTGIVDVNEPLVRHPLRWGIIEGDISSGHPPLSSKSAVV